MVTFACIGVHYAAGGDFGTCPEDALLVKEVQRDLRHVLSRVKRILRDEHCTDSARFYGKKLAEDFAGAAKEVRALLRPRRR